MEPAAPAGTERAGASRTVLAIVLGSLAVRAALLSVLPPVTDEAYYADWARHLAPGYYDHPPAIAWIAAAGLRAIGWTPLGLRAGPLLLQAATSLLGASLAGALGGAAAAVAAALLLQAAPVFSLGAALATPDAPLAFAWVATLWALERALRRGPGWFLAAGAFLGLAALSKLTAGLLGLAVFGGLLSTARGRRALATPWPWAGAAIALAVASPMIRWNAALGWPSLAYQAHHGLSGGGFSLARLAGSLGAQAGYVSPVLLLAAVPPAALALRAPDPARRAIALSALPVIAFFTLSAATTPGALPHWPAPGWLSASILLAAAGSRWLRAAAATGLAAIALALVLLGASAATPLPALGPGDDPRGWREAALAARAAAGGARLASAHWITHGQLGFWSGATPAYLGDRESAPDLYAEGPFRPGEPLLVVTVDRLGPQADALASWVGPLEPAGTFVARDRGVLIRTLRFWRAAAPAHPVPGTWAPAIDPIRPR